MNLALYYVESDSPERLVFRARRVGAYLGGAFLLVAGAAIAVPSWLAFANSSRMPMLLYFVAEGLGLLFLWGGGAFVRLGLTNKDRIIVDSVAREIRVEHARWMEPAVPFDAVKRVVLKGVVERRSSRSPSGVLRREPVFLQQVEIERPDGENLVVDRGSDAEWMLRLATALADRCGVPFDAVN